MKYKINVNKSLVSNIFSFEKFFSEKIQKKHKINTITETYIKNEK